MERIGRKVNFLVDQELFGEIEKIAANEGETLSEIARRTIRAGLGIKKAADQGEVFIQRDHLPAVQIIFLS